MHTVDHLMLSTAPNSLSHNKLRPTLPMHTAYIRMHTAPAIRPNSLPQNNLTDAYGLHTDPLAPTDLTPHEKISKKVYESC